MRAILFSGEVALNQSLKHVKNTDYEPLWAPNMYGGMPAYFISYKYDVANLDTLISQWFAIFLFPANFFLGWLAGFFFLFRYVGVGHFASVFGALTIAFTTYIPISSGPDTIRNLPLLITSLGSC